LQGNAVKAVQDRLQAPKRSNTATDVEAKEAAQELKRSNTAPASGLTEQKVGLVLSKDGAWQLATVANGVWKSVKPIAESFVVAEAKAGKLGTAGDVINAWK
jgi:hypothetical protein